MEYINLKFKSKSNVKRFLDNEYTKYGEYGCHYFPVIGGGNEEIVGYMLIIDAKQENHQGWFQTIKKTIGQGYGVYWVNGSDHDQEVAELTEEQMIDFLWRNRKSAKLPIIY